MSMSEAKTAAEIEDILSSIRRLVSQDRKPAPSQRPQVLSRFVVEDLAPDPVPDPGPVPQPLLLTPAQRVTRIVPDTVAAAWPEGAAPEEAVANPPVVAGGDGAGNVGAGLAAPEPVAPEPPAAEPAPRLHLQPSAAVAADALAWEAEMGDPAPDLSSLDWSSFTFARRPMAETYAARSRAAERLAPTAAPVTPVAPVTPTAAPPAAAALHPVAPIATPRADLTAADPVIEAPAPQPVAEPVAAEPATPLIQEEDSIFSEEVLRELVRDLIREQLQGELGERITRNIRKLVKAEIARAASVRALE